MTIQRCTTAMLQCSGNATTKQTYCTLYNTKEPYIMQAMLPLNTVLVQLGAITEQRTMQWKCYTTKVMDNATTKEHYRAWCSDNATSKEHHTHNATTIKNSTTLNEVQHSVYLQKVDAATNNLCAKVFVFVFVLCRTTHYAPAIYFGKSCCSH